MSQQDLIPISFQISDIDVFPGLSKIPSAVSLKKRATESAPPPSTSNVNTGDNENEDGGQRLEIQERNNGTHFDVGRSSFEVPSPGNKLEGVSVLYFKLLIF